MTWQLGSLIGSVDFPVHCPAIDGMNWCAVWIYCVKLVVATSLSGVQFLNLNCPTLLFVVDQIYPDSAHFNYSRSL
jgi:hypothetical protein